jgi:hypothetical protein
MSFARLLGTLGVLATLAAARPAAGQSVGDPQTAVDPAATDVTPTPTSPWSWIRLPKITMPKIEMPKMPADPFAPIKTSARKVSDGTKRAWEGTKELFTFGGAKSADQPVARTASAAEPPSMWQRMFGGADEKSREPQTVAEFINQPRPE